MSKPTKKPNILLRVTHMEAPNPDLENRTRYFLRFAGHSYHVSRMNQRLHELGRRCAQWFPDYPWDRETHGAWEVEERNLLALKEYFQDLAGAMTSARIRRLKQRGTLRPWPAPTSSSSPAMTTLTTRLTQEGYSIYHARELVQFLDDKRLIPFANLPMWVVLGPPLQLGDQ